MMSGLGILHDDKTAQPCEFGAVYGRWFGAPQAPRAVGELAATLCRGLSVLYGMSPATLERLVLSPPPRVADEGAWFDLAEGVLHVRLPSVGYTADLDAAVVQGSRPGSEWASISLLPYLRELGCRVNAGLQGQSGRALLDCMRVSVHGDHPDRTIAITRIGRS